MTEIQEGRTDRVLYCPRKNDMILVVDQICYYLHRNKDCEGCVYDVDIIKTRFLRLLLEKMESENHG